MKPIYCIGDSNISIFTGENTIPPPWPQRTAENCLPFFKTYRLGPALAYNLPRAGTSVQAREKMFEILEQEVPDGSRVMISFGEIDCRYHMIRQSEKHNRPIEDLVNECADRYFSFVMEIHDLGYRPMIWNVPLVTPYYLDQKHFPMVDSIEQRTHVSRLFNRALALRCEQKDFPFIHIFEKVLNQDARLNMNYLMDVIHLSQKAMPLIVEEVKRFVPEIDFDNFDWETPYYKLPMKKYRLAVITPSLIASQEMADGAAESLASLNQTLEGKYHHIVVDDVPHFKNRLLRKFSDIRHKHLANEVYQGENIRLIRQHGHGSSRATLTAAQEARRTGYEVVFLHLDDMVYIPQARNLMAHAVDAFCRVPDLQMVRLTGIPILSQACTPELGNHTELTITQDKVQFENLTLQPQHFDDYTLWWSSFHANLMQGRYYALPMWFTLFRASFLEKLLTLNDTVANLSHLGLVELYYKDMDNWREALTHIDGELGYINMQFGGLEMQRNHNWESLIQLPNEAAR